MGFIKLYDDGCQDGYITSKNIYYFDIEYNKGDYHGDEHYVVRACLENEEISHGYIVSPRISSMEDAYIYLDSIIEKLRG